MLCALTACQTERVTTSDGWPLPPEPRPMPVPPASLTADRMVFMVGSKPDDTNNNGFPDAIRASVALFSEQHPTALREDGAFVFTLYQQGQSDSPDAKQIAQWRVEGGAAAQSLSMAQYGPCYQFTLSLLDPNAGSESGDRLPLDRADLLCTFEPASGAASFTSAGVRTIQIGSRLLSGG